ncbi:hypothetical protein SDC9_193114 [bioreactor metagenome]|uniref:Uncharacterized protein n=1 Tax=bioreactor metagenome TaxID=1076179 RepID=A0A645I2L6_9ZZZZ
MAGRYQTVQQRVFRNAATADERIDDQIDRDERELPLGEEQQQQADSKQRLDREQQGDAARRRPPEQPFGQPTAAHDEGEPAKTHRAIDPVDRLHALQRGLPIGLHRAERETRQQREHRQDADGAAMLQKRQTAARLRSK